MLTEMADEISSVAVESQLYLTLDVMEPVISATIWSFKQAHEASACGPGGHKSYVCFNTAYETADWAQGARELICGRSVM